MEKTIISIINSIKGSKVQEGGRLNITNEQFECIFEKRASVEEVDQFLEKYKIPLPADYQVYLSTYGGARLFQHTYYGGGIDLLSLNHIIDYWKSYSIDYPYYPIAWSSHSLGAICINQEEIDDKNGYLAWLSSMDPENPIEIKMTFTEWLATLIEENGQEFWL
ncbi:SMI1/KNR4 family protein [Brevibacillus reuszeri]|uniref:SMI1/KNR4 family protein n=1 Tax=Brevibacillus reuszeri TaxID=54915 RepID=UPI000CCC49B3|nr:SMI1/KNR4 family protein [Brevibacillus reuszeri]